MVYLLEWNTGEEYETDAASIGWVLTHPAAFPDLELARIWEEVGATFPKRRSRTNHNYAEVEAFARYLVEHYGFTVVPAQRLAPYGRSWYASEEIPILVEEAR